MNEEDENRTEKEVGASEDEVKEKLKSAGGSLILIPLRNMELSDDEADKQSEESKQIESVQLEASQINETETSVYDLKNSGDNSETNDDSIQIDTVVQEAARSKSTDSTSIDETVNQDRNTLDLNDGECSIESRESEFGEQLKLVRREGDVNEICGDPSNKINYGIEPAVMITDNAGAEEALNEDDKCMNKSVIEEEQLSPMEVEDLTSSQLEAQINAVEVRVDVGSVSPVKPKLVNINVKDSLENESKGENTEFSADIPPDIADDSLNDSVVIIDNENDMEVDDDPKIDSINSSSIIGSEVNGAVEDIDNDVVPIGRSDLNDSVEVVKTDSVEDVADESNKVNSSVNCDKVEESGMNVSETCQSSIGDSENMENDCDVSIVSLEHSIEVKNDDEPQVVESDLDTTDEVIGNSSFASAAETSIEELMIEDDDLQIIDDVPASRTRSGSNVSLSTSVDSSLNLSVSSLDLGKDTSHLAGTKCPHCRQRLNVVKKYKPRPGKSAKDILNDDLVNIMMDEDDQSSLQYKLTDFAVYDKPSSESGGHLVPIFAESLLSTGKKIYLSGKVLRLDCQEGDKGLNVVDIGPITEWTNMTGMEGGQENIILNTRHGGKDLEFNLLKPCDEYLEMFKNTYRMVFMANSIITKLIDCNEKGVFMEYAELLEFIDKLEPPALYGDILQRCDEEFLQLHSDFIVSQVSSFEDAGDVEEDLTIMGMPCIKHISDMAGVDRGAARKPVRKDGMTGSTPQPETHIQAVTTPLVAELFESTFQKQMKLNRAAKAKVCTCKACQANNCGRCERCREMVSFGGVQPDSSVVCLERQCLRRNDQEVVLGDEEKEGVRKDRKTVVRWVGKGKTAGKKTFYNEVMLKFGSSKECKVGAGNFLLVAPDSSEHKSVPHYPCRVLYLVVREVQGRKYDCAHVQWLCRSEHTVLGRTGDPREWFLIDECEDIVLTEVTKVMDIERVVVDDFDRWRKNGGTKKAIIEASRGGKDGWWRMKYMAEFGRFEYPKDEELRLEDESCCFCIKNEEKIKADEVEISSNGNSIRIKNIWFTVGQFIMLEDNTIRFKIPKKQAKVYPKAKVDPKIYPEHWRKKDEYEEEETWDPFQVVRLEEIVKERQETCIRVRKLYRPHDTHMKHEVARTKAYSCLYWTEEIARMHLPENAKRTNKVSMESIVDIAYVKGQIGGDSEELIDWSDAGEDRFFISEAYNADRKQFTPLQPDVVASMDTVLTQYPAPVIAEVIPLACLDIFAGCGGLSRGLHESGVTQHKWAIEFWPPSAEAFKKNNPECEVLNAECNGLLSKAMTGEKGTKMPEKGQVDILVGGPPCQGFSLLNIYKEREYSKFKNSLIPTYLSYCDFYRPKYYILENVRNLVANENGMVLKLILATLVKMGYQVAFNILQAGHYGVAQTRRRLIVLAAAPGEVLPVYPEPEHCFQGPHFMEIEVDGRKFSTTSIRPGAPRRSLTCWDAISDLPPIPSGHDNQSIPYSYKAKGKVHDGKHESHLQKMFKSHNPPGSQLSDHICKDVNALCLERIRHVPTTPGSDWRDLPNTVVKLDDGRVTKKLHYPYKKPDGTRGVCSCSLSSKKRMHFCDADDKQSETMIAWSLPHTADRHNNWQGVYGRVPWDGIFKTTITDPEPLGKQGQVVHPEQDRLLSVREYARSQGFKDNFKFAGTIRDKHREIGNAVPPFMGKALGLEIRKAILEKLKPSL